MTSVTQVIDGAPLATYQWEAINWRAAEKHVRRLQMRIAKATREGRYGKVKSLQRILTHSYMAKLLAVKRVVQNKGGRTAGVDGKKWSTDNQKLQGVLSLRNKGYKPLPLKRIYIPKKDGQRPLSIPTIRDRSMQALHLLALLPIAETKADNNSYGFRPKRSCADAIEQCFRALAKKTFRYVDAKIFEAIWRWAKRRHPEKNTSWRRKKYFMKQGGRSWIFYAKFQRPSGEQRRTMKLFRLPDIKIQRYIKVRGKATPFDPEYKEYFEYRDRKECTRSRVTKP